MDTPTFEDRVAGEVRAEMARQGVTRTALAAAVGISLGQVSRRLSGQIPLTLHDLDSFAVALQVPPVELVQRARTTTAA